jgi:hypothetical protein
MDHAETPLPPPPPPRWEGRALFRFATVHPLFLVACFAVGEATFRLLGNPRVYEIGTGEEFPTLQSAELAMAVDIARSWVAVGVFSMAVVLAVWLWKRPFRWFWIPLAFVPFLGPLFFAGPATWVLANGPTRPAAPKRLGNVVTSRLTRRT